MGITKNLFQEKRRENSEKILLYSIKKRIKYIILLSFVFALIKSYIIVVLKKRKMSFDRFHLIGEISDFYNDRYCDIKSKLWIN